MLTVFHCNCNRQPGASPTLVLARLGMWVLSMKSNGIAARPNTVALKTIIYEGGGYHARDLYAQEEHRLG